MPMGMLGKRFCTGLSTGVPSRRASRYKEPESVTIQKIKPSPLRLDRRRPCDPENDLTRSASPDPLEEGKLIRRMQMMMNMVMQVIAQDGSLTIDEASQMIADSRKAALAMFPDKELAYELIWRPRFQRLMRERFRIM